MSVSAPSSANNPPTALRVFLVAAEESGDRLGAPLMRALSERAGVPIRFSGVGGRAMAAEGLASLHSIDDFAIIGLTAIPGHLPKIARHLRQTLRAVREEKPDVLVIIDSPGYTQWLAWFVHRADPSIPIVNYVSPSVWAWHSSRARSMRSYIDHVLALLPFEPEVHRSLGGPPCTYVGHPLIEQIDTLRPSAEEAQRRSADPPLIVVLPGSRRAEIRRLAGPFGAAIAMVRERHGPIEVVVPGVLHLKSQLLEAAANWPFQPRVIFEEAEKRAAFRTARAALAKSGTVTLELALAGVPMVTAYKGSAFEACIARRLVRVPSIILANLVLGEKVVPEFLQQDATPRRLSDALLPLIGDTPERRVQTEAFARLDAIMGIGSHAPAARAADIVLAAVRRTTN